MDTHIISVCLIAMIYIEPGENSSFSWSAPTRFVIARTSSPTFNSVMPRGKITLPLSNDGSNHTFIV